MYAVAEDELVAFADAGIDGQSTGDGLLDYREFCSAVLNQDVGHVHGVPTAAVVKKKTTSRG